MYLYFTGYLNSTEDVNIISVSWPALSESLYTMSAVAVAPVGRYTGLMLDRLVSEVGVSADSFHLVGHSLGAHICGVAGETFSGGNLSRISGKTIVRVFGTTTDWFYTTQFGVVQPGLFHPRIVKIQKLAMTVHMPTRQMVPEANAVTL